MREGEIREAQISSAAQGWPDLSAVDRGPTLRTLHLWSQVIGKVRLSLTPWENHSWHVPLYVTARGLGVDLIPAPPRALSFEFNLLEDVLEIGTTDGSRAAIALSSGSVASFYAATMKELARLGVDLKINTMPSEIADATRFEEDVATRIYDGAAARAFWRALVQTHRVFQRFRTRFVGKCSPIHLFWGSFDLAVTRFSGRPAPRHPGGAPHLPDAITREAYCQELSSAGFWPGFDGLGPCFYSYAYPTPEKFSEAKIRPDAAHFDSRLGEFLLPYTAVVTSRTPDLALMDFLQSTYEAAADLGAWDRPRLERIEGPLGHPPPEA